MKTAVIYCRTSSASNVGTDKDSLPRQETAVRSFAERNNIKVVREFYDPAVSGADPIDTRKGFSEMLVYLLGNGARTIIVETAGRFARDLMVQETGYQMLKLKGIELIAADSPDSFVSDTPTAVFIRQVLGAASQFDKTLLVDKLRGARDRKSARLGYRIEGAKRLGRIPTEHVKAALRLSKQSLSLRAISASMATQGILSSTGVPYSPRSVSIMLKRAAK